VDAKVIDTVIQFLRVLVYVRPIVTSVSTRRLATWLASRANCSFL